MGGGGGGVYNFSLELKTVDDILNLQEFFHACYVMLHMPITYVYFPKMFLCKGVLSKHFEYVSLQHKQPIDFKT